MVSPVSWPWPTVPAPSFTPVTSITPHLIPSSPGVYAWAREGRVVYLGVAASGGGLRSRIRTHLGTSTDLSRSAFRRSVAEHVLDVAGASRKRLRTLDVKEVAVVNDWVRECSVGWIETARAEEARELEERLLAQHQPLLNRRQAQ